MATAKMIALTLVVYNEKYELIHSEHGWLGGDRIEQPEFLGRMAAQLAMKAGLGGTVHATFIVGHVGKEVAQAWASEVRRIEPDTITTVVATVEEKPPGNTPSWN